MGRVLRLNRNRISATIVETTAETISAGGTIIYPTDTIYGFGCDALNQRAVERVFRVKRRPKTNPALLLVDSKTMVNLLVAKIPPDGKRLIRSFWPGPLTIIFQSRFRLHPFITSKRSTIALRVPDDRFCLRLIGRCTAPILSTSANLSGAGTDTDVAEIRTLFRDAVDLFIDAGDLPRSSQASTIVDVTGNRARIVRLGALGADQIERCLRLHA